MKDEDRAARLSSLYNEYDRQCRYLMLLDRESLFEMAQSKVPDLPATTPKSECANVFMEHSLLGRRIAKLEQMETQEPALIECLIPNQHAVEAIRAGGYVCEEIGSFLYRTNAPLQDGVAVQIGGKTLKLQGGKVFPVAQKRDRS
jgi:hypothetical protein